MILAHGFPLATSDIDAVPVGLDLFTLDSYVKKVAKELGLPADWLNSYYSTFTHVLPSDYGNRLKPVLILDKLEVLALSKDDLLIMKCFAGRQKDVSHAKALMKKGANIKFIEKHIESLYELKIPGARNALDFLDDLLDQVSRQ